MKYSDYNTILPLSEKLGLVYCGSTDQFVIYKRALTPLLESISADQLAIEAPSLYAELVRGGGIVNDEENEFVKLKRLADEVECSPKTYRLILNPTMDCNFKCWYCYENHITGSKMSTEVLNRVLLMISRIIRTQKDLEFFDLSFFGGETLLYYAEIVRPILDHCRQECQRFGVHLLVNFTSNGYLINDKTIAHLTEKDELKSFQITLDGNRERHDKTRFPLRGEGSYNIILTNVKRLLDCGIEVILRINYTASNILSVKDALNDINTIDEKKRKLLTISFHRVWQDSLPGEFPHTGRGALGRIHARDAAAYTPGRNVERDARLHDHPCTSVPHSHILHTGEPEVADSQGLRGKGSRDTVQDIQQRILRAGADTPHQGVHRGRSQVRMESPPSAGDTQGCHNRLGHSDPGTVHGRERRPVLRPDHFRTGGPLKRRLHVLPGAGRSREHGHHRDSRVHNRQSGQEETGVLGRVRHDTLPADDRPVLLVLGLEYLVHALHRGQAFRDVVSCPGEFLQRIQHAVKYHHIIYECRRVERGRFRKDECASGTPQPRI